MQTKTTKQILIDARALISAEGGWMRGELKDGDCYCAIGAVTTARGIDIAAIDEVEFDSLIYDNNDPTLAALAAEIPKSQRIHWDSRPASELWNWNDHWDRRQEDVVKLFDRAIERLEE